MRIRIVSTDCASNQIHGEFLELFPDNLDILLEKKFHITRIDESSQLPLDDTPIASNVHHRDLTNHNVFTIDPLGCQDADDAFSIVNFAPNDIRIYVHIADVASYINPDHPDFENIIARGNTFYGDATNWPMIPAKYANDICSILPNKITKVITTEFKYDSIARTVEYVDWYFSIVKSRAKYDYDTADAQIANNCDFQTIYDSSCILKLRIDDFTINRETSAHSMVKYWMIATNIVMCKELQLIWRVNPTPSDFTNIRAYMKRFDPEFAREWDGNREALVKYVSSKNEPLLNYLVKMMLTKAKYTASNGDHYGLGMDNYTHWTSPIRRAADLLNHCAAHGYTPIDLAKYLPAINNAELVQDNLEAFMLNYKSGNNAKIGQIFNASIIEINQFGITVFIADLNNSYRIHISRLSRERLTYNDSNKTLTSANCKFELFDSLKVIVAKKTIETMELVII